MSRSDLWKWLALVMLAMLSVLVVVPTKRDDSGKLIPKIRLGIDLKGGSSFVVTIDEDKLINNVKMDNPDLDDQQVNAKVKEILKGAPERTIEVIRNRIDKTGINEPLIQAGKEHRITIQLPGITEDKRAEAEKNIKSAAFLEFKLVHAQNDNLVDKLFRDGRVPEGYVAGEGRTFKRVAAAEYNEIIKDPEYFHRLSLFELPNNDPRYAFMLEAIGAGADVYRPVFLLRRAEMNGSALASASVETDTMTGAVSVGLRFNAKGTAEFARLTGKHVGRQLAIVMDDTLYSAPVIKQALPDGIASITGSFSRSDAAQLRNILNAGSLPAPMKILEARNISPTLGQDAIDSGIRAGIIGIVLVMGFMLIYYMYSGFIANIALILNVLLLPAGLILVSNVLGVFVPDASGGAKNALALPVLTMPGIAGMVLTLGMAVDANVLIFERIREEAATGKSVRASIAAGYDRAFLAIFDSNITTLIVGALLFIFGLGPIRGYAITLSAGIIISMFTALVVTRLMFNATISETRTKPLTMFQFFKTPNFDFLKPAKLFIIASCLIIISTCTLFGIRVSKEPASVMTVDFVGGAAISYACKAQVGTSDIRDAIVPSVVNDATIQYQSAAGAAGDVLLIMTSNATVGEENSSTLILKALTEKFPQAEFQLLNEDTVGAVVGSDLKRAAQLSILFSLIGILFYISLRFEFGFAVGSVVALAHDAFFTLGVYSLLGYQMSLTTVAALLTIIGYSVNNSIVIFDRIREDLRKDSKTEFKELCNRSINATLSRTVLTSLTTIFAALVLFLFGGGAINDFALAILIGLVIGTFSSIYMAPSIMLACYRGRRPSFMQKDK
ncbi:MAG: protein translocase subunit SecD [Kiritimatiellaeota bacterium]|nr:protein translocase subunit SecD [Kiritimatiellota bacterium]